MTNVPESFLAKEAGMAYATVAMVTDYDCWREAHCTVGEIMEAMRGNGRNAQRLIRELAPRIAGNKFEYPRENAAGLMGDPEGLPPEKRRILDVLLS